MEVKTAEEMVVVEMEVVEMEVVARVEETVANMVL